ncbi:MAG: cbb3-type cytochrome c oxidase subunit 3 [Proteobacteria bacterium]|nr:cbb3-type cytochrome c oxidase subunit 3 [Pseudomonadota bacterium]
MDARSVVTVVSLLTFIGIVIWAWSGRRKADFDEAANLPFADEEDDMQQTQNTAEKQHG